MIDLRPISMISYMLERLIHMYIRDQVLLRRPLYGNQYAYRAARLVEIALHQTGHQTGEGG